MVNLFGKWGWKEKKWIFSLVEVVVPDLKCLTLSVYMKGDGNGSGRDGKCSAHCDVYIKWVSSKTCPFSPNTEY